MQILGQRDPRWANTLLGFGEVTIGNDGCFITEIAQAIGSTPDVVNSNLKQVGGFTDALVVWDKLAEAFPGISAVVHSSYDNDAVLASLAAGNRVLVVVSATPIGGNGEHCVEYIGNHALYDPWTASQRPTNDFPDILGEWVEIIGQWNQGTENSVASTEDMSTPESQASSDVSSPPPSPSPSPAEATTSTPVTTIATEGLNTYGLDPTNLQSNQEVFDSWHKVSQGLYVTIEQYNQQKQIIEDLQKDILDLQSKHNEDQKEIINLNSSLSALSTSNKDYATQALDAEKIAQDYTGYMDDFAKELDLQQNNQTDQELHDEIIKEIIRLQENQKTPQGQETIEETATVWQTSLKSVIDWLLKHGFDMFLKENNLHVVDNNGNLLDAQLVADRIIAYLDTRFSRLDFLEALQQKGKAQMQKGVSLLQQFLGLFYKNA